MTVDVKIDVLENSIPVEKKAQLLLSVGRPVVAMAMIGEWHKSVPFVHSVFVSRRHRRRGIARALVREAVRLATKAGKVSLNLWVDPKNEPAIALYRSEGFVVVTGETPLMMNHCLNQ